MELQNLNLEKQIEKFEEKTGYSFQKFYRQYHSKLVWYAQTILHNQQEAEDLASDAFIKSLVKIDMYNPEYNYSTWLFTMTQKMAIQRLKDKKKIPIVSDENDFLKNTVLDTVYDDLEATKQKDKTLRKHIAKLDAKYRKVIEMREYQGLPYKTISEMLGINLSTIKSQIRQGRLLLQKNVKEEFEFIEDNY